ncbi:hypothetical protein [Streptomyces ipomoeae]|uniref:hypothetical protein n=1 Tax=Streptomyces ipomoeae TaxID=103232 RepID=UPI0011474387|nr:hypothetical protein [Streptomyces ipomoeae]MDX2939535.1 hypothetical protein [Streptomyces ipomoeae]TQE27965.1 hypothetical protein SipoB123_10845 [Streptomyces ipomoeae]
MAVIKAMGGVLVFDQEHLLTTSTRAPGGGVLDVVFDARDGGTIRLALAVPGAGTPGDEGPGESASLRFKNCGHLAAGTCDDDCDEINAPAGMIH